jgi:hypothetical protein
MKASISEFLAKYPVGCKVLLKPLGRRRGKDWTSAVVVEHFVGRRTVAIRCREEITGQPAYIVPSVGSKIKRACEAEGCWQPAALVVEGKNYCGDHLPADNSVPG